MSVLTALLLTTLGLLAATSALHASPPPQIAGVRFSIADSESGANSGSGSHGDSITMRVAANGAEEMAGAQFDIVFDPSVVMVEGVVGLGADSGILSDANVVEDGRLRIVYAGATASGLDVMQIADVTFKILGESGAATSLTIDNLLVADALLQALRHSAIDGSIIVVGGSGGGAALEEAPEGEALQDAAAPSVPSGLADRLGDAQPTGIPSPDQTGWSTGTILLASAIAVVVLVSGVVISRRRLRSSR